MTKPVIHSTQAVDAELRQRVRRFSGTLVRLLSEWARDPHGQAMLFDSRGPKGETYLHHLLARREHETVAALLDTCGMMLDSTIGSHIAEFLASADNEGNGTWHYLAQATAVGTDEAWLAIVERLAKLGVPIQHKNAAGDSAVISLWQPVPQWPVFDALVKQGGLTIEGVVDAFNPPAGTAEDERTKRLAAFLVADIAENGGEVCQAVIARADNDATTRKERTAMTRAFFQCTGGDAGDTPFLKLLETDLVETVARLGKVLLAHANEETGSGRTPNRMQQQSWLYKRLVRSNRLLYGPLAKAIIANRAAHIVVLQDLLRNEDLSIVIDDTSPAPSNPWLSLMLQQDALGNLPLHTAVMFGRPECLAKLIGDLSMPDLNLMLRGVPNRFNLTVVDLSLPAAAQAKLGMEIQAKRITVEAAQTIFAQIQKFHTLTQKPLNDLVKRATEGAAKAAASGAKPGFDLARVASVQYLKRAGVK